MNLFICLKQICSIPFIVYFLINWLPKYFNNSINLISKPTNLTANFTVKITFFQYYFWKKCNTKNLNF